MSPFVLRCVLSFALFAITFGMPVKFLEHSWATIMSLYPGAEYSYTDTLDLYANILRWDEPKQNYNSFAIALALSTRCTYFHIWAMCIPFFVTRRGIRSVISDVVTAILAAGSLTFVINGIRLSLVYSAVNADIPWWLAHDIPNIGFGLAALILSIEYFRRSPA